MRETKNKQTQKPKARKMIWKTPKCPHCTKTLNNMGVEFANVRVICANCQQEVDPNILIDSYSVDFFAELIPEEYKENFLKEVGFERKPGNLIPKGVLRFLVTLAVILIAIGTLLIAIMQGITQSSLLAVFWNLLGGGILIMTFIYYYKEATKPKWRKTKRTNDLASSK